MLVVSNFGIFFEEHKYLTIVDNLVMRADHPHYFLYLLFGFIKANRDQIMRMGSSD